MQALSSVFSKFTIRTRGVIVVVSLLAIIGVGMTLLIRVLDHFSGQLREGSVNQAEIISNAMVCKRYHLLLYHRLGKILVHPLRDIDSASNTAVYVCNAMQEPATNPDQSLQAKGCI
jgi:hypothetical protein